MSSLRTTALPTRAPPRLHIEGNAPSAPGGDASSPLTPSSEVAALLGGPHPFPEAAPHAVTRITSTRSYPRRKERGLRGTPDRAVRRREGPGTRGSEGPQVAP